MRETIYAGDSFVVVVTVMDGATPFDLAGAVVAAGAVGPGPRVQAAATVTDAAGGVARLVWPPGALGVGDWRASLRVTKGGDAQTVWTGEILVLPSPAP